MGRGIKNFFKWAPVHYHHVLRQSLNKTVPSCWIGRWRVWWLSAVFLLMKRLDQHLLLTWNKDMLGRVKLSFRRRLHVFIKDTGNFLSICEKCIIVLLFLFLCIHVFKFFCFIRLKPTAFRLYFCLNFSITRVSFLATLKVFPIPYFCLFAVLILLYVIPTRFLFSKIEKFLAI